jgi:quercetin dioxygenase-like cupin family protein
MIAKIGGYTRITKHLCEHVEVVTITWPPGSRTPKHNHHSNGEVEVFAGEVFEIDANGDVTVHATGSAVFEPANGQAHIFGNSSNEVAITIHRYFSPGPHGLVMDIFDDDVRDCAALRRLFANAPEEVPVS